MRCDHCEYRDSEECSKRRMANHCFCKRFKLDYSSLSDFQKNSIQIYFMDDLDDDE